MIMWYKDGAPYAGPKMSLEWYAANGYTTEQPVMPALEPPPKRYSKLAIYDALGDERWTAILATLTDARKRRLELAQELSTEDADFAAVLEALRASNEDADTILAAAEL